MMLAAGIALLVAAVWLGPLRRNLMLSAASATVVALCFVLILYGLFFAAPITARARYPMEQALAYVAVPLFLMLPAAVAYSAAGLTRRGSPSLRMSRTVSTGVGLVAVAVAPLGALVAGCGLAGACF